MRIQIEPAWRFRNAEGREIDPLLFQVLAAVQRSGKLTQAAREVGFSYRHCWNLIRTWSAFFGTPLVELSQGRGAALTPLGEKLTWAAQRIQARLSPQLENLSVEIDREINASLMNTQPVLRLHASHGYAVALLPDLIGRIAGVRLELQYLGAIDGLSSMARGSCDLCGFHLPSGRLSPDLTAQLMRHLKPRAHRIIRLVRRTQGLFVATGNPLGIRSLQDLTRKDVRFINRQASSGTRVLLDLMLAEAGIDADRVSGYETVEFTHAAVAAHIASGMADTGFGVEAAATQFKLDFVPIAKEDYFLACRAEALELPSMQRLLEALKSAEFLAAVSRLPGYSADAPGEVLSVVEALRA
ncbi:substrate-binding domain-containing protein [Methyloversatilis thermotolerans]|uniref:helix-turn-helix transcriptional regulator n=1 Tax=Methyloversatilis thermotolerans TaxID=1346290 RepID=UPI00036BFC71|nr:substrate-binding domain-containing protein [Methyloversatilis thermotolerans]